MALTLSQVLVLLNRIDRRRLTTKHQEYSFLASLHRVKIPSLEELGVVSLEQAAAPIDKKASKELDEYVKQRVAEKRAKWQQTNS